MVVFFNSTTDKTNVTPASSSRVVDETNSSRSAVCNFSRAQLPHESQQEKVSTTFLANNIRAGLYWQFANDLGAERLNPRQDERFSAEMEPVVRPASFSGRLRIPMRRSTDSDGGEHWDIEGESEMDEVSAFSMRHKQYAPASEVTPTSLSAKGIYNNWHEDETVAVEDIYQDLNRHPELSSAASPRSPELNRQLLEYSDIQFGRLNDDEELSAAQEQIEGERGPYAHGAGQTSPNVANKGERQRTVSDEGQINFSGLLQTPGPSKGVFQKNTTDPPGRVPKTLTSTAQQRSDQRTVEALAILKRCQICRLPFASWKKTARHLRKEHKMDFCPVCFRAFSICDATHRIHFHSAHAVDEDGKAQCPLCPHRKLLRYNGMIVHHAKKHFPIVKRLNENRGSDSKRTEGSMSKVPAKRSESCPLIVKPSSSGTSGKLPLSTTQNLAVLRNHPAPKLPAKRTYSLPEDIPLLALNDENDSTLQRSASVLTTAEIEHNMLTKKKLRPGFSIPKTDRK